MVVSVQGGGGAKGRGLRVGNEGANLNCTDNYDVAKIKVKSVTDHQ